MPVGRGGEEPEFFHRNPSPDSLPKGAVHGGRGGCKLVCGELSKMIIWFPRGIVSPDDPAPWPPVWENGGVPLASGSENWARGGRWRGAQLFVGGIRGSRCQRCWEREACMWTCAQAPRSESQHELGKGQEKPRPQPRRSTWPRAVSVVGLGSVEGLGALSPARCGACAAPEEGLSWLAGLHREASCSFLGGAGASVFQGQRPKDHYGDDAPGDSGNVLLSDG